MGPCDGRELALACDIMASPRLASLLLLLGLAACGRGSSQGLPPPVHGQAPELGPPAFATEPVLVNGTPQRVLGKRAFEAANADLPTFVRLGEEPLGKFVGRARARLDDLDRELLRLRAECGDRRQSCIDELQQAAGALSIARAEIGDEAEPAPSARPALVSTAINDAQRRVAYARTELLLD